MRPRNAKKMVLAGYYGRKSGSFYDYSGEKPVPTDLDI